MKVLHLLSEWKNTGPAKLVHDLCKNHSIDYSINITQHDDSPLREMLRNSRINTINELSLLKNRWVSLIKDARRLSEISTEYNIIHSHHTHDLAVSILSRLLFDIKSRIVFTSYHKNSLAGYNILRYFKKYIDHYITYSADKLSKEIKLHGLKKTACSTIIPGIEFNGATRATRDKLGICREDFVGTIIMRVQKHRRFDIVIESAKKIKDSIPNLKILILGRGTKFQELVQIPIQENHLEDSLIAIGYKTNYLEYLSVSDFFIYTSPGSDGTARALREALYMGKPSIVFKTGFVQDICGNYTTILIPPKSSALVAAINVLYKDRELRQKLGEDSRYFAVQNYDIKTQTTALEALYYKILKKN